MRNSIFVRPYRKTIVMIITPVNRCLIYNIPHRSIAKCWRHRYGKTHIGKYGSWLCAIIKRQKTIEKTAFVYSDCHWYTSIHVPWLKKRYEWKWIYLKTYSKAVEYNCVVKIFSFIPFLYLSLWIQFILYHNLNTKQVLQSPDKTLK